MNNTKQNGLTFIFLSVNITKILKLRLFKFMLRREKYDEEVVKG